MPNKAKVFTAPEDTRSAFLFNPRPTGKVDEEDAANKEDNLRVDKVWDCATPPKACAAPIREMSAA